MSYCQKSEQSSGAFFGRVAAEWVDHRMMVLIESFIYRDSTGAFWHVPENAEIDGASIPRALWWLIGSPYVGCYRQASVVHDHYCRLQARPSADVHRMFHDACLTAGVHPLKAWLMYQAVAWFGPRWRQPGAARR
jgi:hypothetical protein